MASQTPKIILVLGATGGIGGEVARAFLRRGWTVRGLKRSPGPFAKLPGVDWRQGDAMNRQDVVDAARDASMIFHGVNPPGYQNWSQLALPMLENTIAAAQAAGARIMFPGTVYNFGPETFPLIAEDAPQQPKTRKGAIRVAMESRLEAAAREGTPVLIVRAGDFFGPDSGNSWFAQGMVKPGKPLTSVTYPGRRDAGHAWAYLPDFGETFARLIEHEDRLGDFARFHFGGHSFLRGVDMAEAVRRVSGDATLPIRGFPWPVLLALSPVVRLFREMAEMRYLWREDLRLDNRKLIAFLGAEPHTPLDVAIAHTLEGLGCLPGAAPPAPAHLAHV